jgi:hypothetical protein
VDRGLGVRLEQQRAEQHRRDERDRVRFEEVGRHPGAVADVVAHVSAITPGCADSSSGIPASTCHEIGAHIGALREDAAAQPREDRDQRRRECETDERLDRVVQPFGHRVGAPCAERSGTIETGDAEKPRPTTSCR